MQKLLRVFLWGVCAFLSSSCFVSPMQLDSPINYDHYFGSTSLSDAVVRTVQRNGGKLKFQFVPQRSFIAPLKLEEYSRKQITEQHYDTSNWDFARVNLFIKETNKNNATIVLVKRVGQFDPSIRLLEYEDFEFNSLAGALRWLQLAKTTSTDWGIVPTFRIEDVQLKTKVMVERVEGSYGLVTIRFEKVTYAKGDIYAVCSVESNAKFLKANLSNLERGSQLKPSRSKFAEWLLRYEPQLLDELSKSFSSSPQLPPYIPKGFDVGNDPVQLSDLQAALRSQFDISEQSIQRLQESLAQGFIEEPEGEFYEQP